MNYQPHFPHEMDLFIRGPSAFRTMHASVQMSLNFVDSHWNWNDVDKFSWILSHRFFPSPNRHQHLSSRKCHAIINSLITRHQFNWINCMLIAQKHKANVCHQSMTSIIAACIHRQNCHIHCTSNMFVFSSTGLRHKFSHVCLCWLSQI